MHVHCHCGVGGICVFMPVYVEVRGQPWVVLQGPLAVFFLRWAVLLAWYSSSSADGGWPVKPRDPPFFVSPELGLQALPF